MTCDSSALRLEPLDQILLFPVLPETFGALLMRPVNRPSSSLALACSLIAATLITLAAPLQAGPPESLQKNLIFLAPFDGSLDATIGQDKRIHTAENLERKVVTPGNSRTDVTLAPQAGRYGGALRFATSESPKVTLFKGVNAGYSASNWSGTVSFWLKLTPDQDLKPGYCDPIQITDKTWNDASFFVDFDKDLPRVFRLGVFSNYKSWNPADTAWEKIEPKDRPMVPVAMPPFSRDRWTHVAWTFNNFNTANNSPGSATLYLNGKSQGSLKSPMTFTWDPAKAVIMLGIAYTGDFDELAIFNRALSDAEITTVYELPAGLTP
ncbi:MAG TPA: hypothetical protein DCR20_03170 [Planctomycetaceae bacterium]|nr:hypothetical protein [Planctomycetaceae bacterium]